MSPNARWLVASKVATQLGDLLCNAKTTVTWLMLAAGAPAGLVGLLVPVRESGSMLPQVFIAPWVARIEPRKRVAIAALVAQAIAAVLLAGLDSSTWGVVAGVCVIATIGVLSLARAFTSLASKDVLARAVPKGARGKVSGRATSLAGLVGLGGAAAALFVHRPESVGLLAMVVGASAIGFGLSALTLLRVEETEEKGTAQGKPRLRDALSEPELRRFVLVRTLLSGSALGGPFIVALGREGTTSLQTLSAFVLAGGAASFVSAGAWGRLADVSGRGCMAAGGALATLAAAVVLGTQATRPDLPIWAWAALYFLFTSGYTGVRVGRKTYVVDVSEGDRRTQFIASSNTLVAIALLIIGAGMAALPSATTSLALCAALTAAGALGCATLAET